VVAQGTFRALIHIGPVERLRAPMLLQTTLQATYMSWRGLFLVIYGCDMMVLRG
jgi:hypothetical protein